jgi:ABC-type Zn2+ transport system substrate-binding protein/surface adhesin
MNDDNTSAGNPVTEIDTAPSTTVMMTDDHDTSGWLEIKDGKFVCAECENEVEPETNSVEGVVKANLEEIKSDLAQYPTKVVYGICSVCGMEYIFRHKDDKLFLEKSDMEK